jgi:hypothetical protein
MKTLLNVYYVLYFSLQRFFDSFFSTSYDSFRIKPSDFFPSELTSYYGSYRQLLGLLGRMIGPTQGR